MVMWTLYSILLQKLGCDPTLPDNDGDMAIHIACLSGQLSVVKYLINEQHCDPNCRGQCGRTPLHYACQNDHMELIHYLITELGCDPTLPDNDGNMPIHIACLCGTIECSQVPYHMNSTVIQTV